MISEEKTMMKLLRDYYICKLYVQTLTSTRNISSQTGISPAAIKRALHIIEERREDLTRLLPKAIEKAISEGLDVKEEKICDLSLEELQGRIEMASYNLQKKTKWASSSLQENNKLVELTRKINEKYCSNNRNVSLTKMQVKHLKDVGCSYGKIAEELGIAKTTAYNYYKAEEKLELETERETYNARRR